MCWAQAVLEDADPDHFQILSPIATLGDPYRVIACNCATVCADDYGAYCSFCRCACKKCGGCRGAAPGAPWAAPPSARRSGGSGSGGGDSAASFLGGGGGGGSLLSEGPLSYLAQGLVLVLVCLAWAVVFAGVDSPRAHLMLVTGGCVTLATLAGYLDPASP
jgi:hypothetical protein